MNRITKISENKLRRVIRESIKRVLKENVEDFYSEEDFDGKTGEPGMVKSYDIGYYGVSQAEYDAQECGYDSLEDYLNYWWGEIGYETPWTWEKLGSGYGYNGETITTIDNVRIKDIFGQIMVDEYPPKN